MHLSGNRARSIPALVQAVAVHPKGKCRSSASMGVLRVFVYLPSSDASVELAYYVERLGSEVVLAIEAFGTRVLT